MKEVDITVVVLTDEFNGKDERDHSVPPIGDESAYTLPLGSYGYQIYSQNIVLWNFSVLGF